MKFHTSILVVVLACACESSKFVGLDHSIDRDDLFVIEVLLTGCDMDHDELIRAHERRRLDRCANEIGVMAAGFLVNAPADKFSPSYHCKLLRRVHTFANTHHPGWPEVERAIGVRCPAAETTPRRAGQLGN